MTMKKLVWQGPPASVPGFGYFEDGDVIEYVNELAMLRQFHEVKGLDAEPADESKDKKKKVK